jgi:hypothetical protein
MTRGLREAYKGEYIIGQRPNLVKDMPGPGYAIKFNSGGGSMYFNRPDDNWTASYWYRPINAGDGLKFQEAGELGETKIGHNQFIMRLSSTRVCAWSSFSTLDYTTDMTGGWNSITMVKKNGIITLYMNGYVVLTMTPGMGDNGKLKDVNMSKLALGSLSGYIDEVQVWDTAFSENDIRTWMCRKIKKHPLQNDRLLLYLNFNEGQGGRVENAYGKGEMELSGNYSWVPSGVPLGDSSVFFYPAQVSDSFQQPGRTISIMHRDGDMFKVVMSSDKNWAYIRGIQLYRVDGAAQLSALPGQIKSWRSEERV